MAPTHSARMLLEIHTSKKQNLGVRQNGTHCPSPKRYELHKAVFQSFALNKFFISNSVTYNIMSVIEHKNENLSEFMLCLTNVIFWNGIVGINVIEVGNS